MAILEICSTTTKTDDFKTIQTFLANENIEIGTFTLNAMAQKLAQIDNPIDTERAALLDSYKDISNQYAKYSDLTSDVVCIYPQHEHIDFILTKFSDVHYHFEHEFWYFFDGSFTFIYLSHTGIKFKVTVKAGEYLQVPEGKWQYFGESLSNRMKAMRFIFSTGQMIRPAPISFESTSA